MLSVFSFSLNTLFSMNSDVTWQTPPSCTAVGEFSGEPAKFEFEAAEALACLSHPVDEDGASGETELCVDAVADREAQEKRIDVKFDDEKEVAIQTGYESELKTSLVCDLNYPPPVTNRTSRRELTEAEKEERRMRRVLANRESAKRTIRRRQAMREEMRRKADDLALENENLKKIKELAAAEYNSLKNKNNNLRMQIAKNVKTEVEETYDDSKSTLVKTHTSTTSTTSLHNQMPLILSSVLPCFDGLLLQRGGMHSISSITPPVLTSPGEGTTPSDKLESSVMVMMNNNVPGSTPLYIVPFPWQMQSHPFRSSTTSYPDDQRFRSTSSPFVLPQAIATQNEIIQQNILYTPDVGRVASASAEMHRYMF